MRSKKTYLKYHSRQRAEERYSFVPNKYDLSVIVNLIKNNKAIFLERRSNRITNWKVTYNNNEYTVGYDSKRHVVATFLNPTEKAIEKKN